MPLDTMKPSRSTKLDKKGAVVPNSLTETAVAPPNRVVIEPPKFREGVIRIRGVAPYCQHAFSQKARKQMEETHRAGQQARSRRKRDPRDFNSDYEQAMHKSREGWPGIPAPSFRNALISACRLVGFKMTVAKLSVFVEADGFDAVDGTPLVKIEGKPHIHEACVRNESGVVDIRWRPMWNEWAANVRLRWDSAQFSISDVVNLMARAGLQVGIGEGRPDSPNSNGLGWGMWRIDQ